MTTRARWAVGAAILAAVTVWASLAGAQDLNQWNRNKGDCEYVLKAPERYPLPSVDECVRLWEQYRDVSGLSPDERALYSRGPSWLFVYGSQEQKTLATGALTRMGTVQPLSFKDGVWSKATSGGAGRVEEDVQPLQALPPVQVKAAGKAAEKKASKLNTEGFKLYKKKSYAAAIGKFEAALQADPYYVKAKYNMACNQSLVGDKEGALRSLLELQSWQSGEAQAAFQNARKDSDFEPLHSDKRFRMLLGLVRLQILNGADEPGLYHVAQIRKGFIDRNYVVHSYGFDRHIRKRPLIYYREGYERQADLAKELVNNIRTSVKKINWESPYDLIVVWGDPEVAAKSGATGPLVQGTSVKRDPKNPLKDVLNTAKDLKDQTQEVQDAATPPPLPGVPQ